DTRAHRVRATRSRAKARRRHDGRARRAFPRLPARARRLRVVSGPETTEGAAMTQTVESLYRGTHDLWEAKVGDDLGTLPFRVSPEAVRRNAWANDDYNPWYVDTSPWGRPIVTPVFLASFDAQLFYGYYAYPRGGSLFAKQEFEFLAPVFVGEDYVI